MTARAYALVTGIFVLVLGAAIAFSLYWFGGSHATEAPYIVVANESIMGLHGQSTVYYRGVPVGNVTAIHLAPHDVRKTYIRIAIAGKIPITASTYAKLNAQGVTGLSTLELNDSGASSKRLPTSDEHPAEIPLTGAGLGSLTSSGQALIKKLNNVADALQSILSSGNRQRINAILRNTETLTARLARLEKHLDESLSGLPGLTQDARNTLHRADKLAAHLTDLTGSLHKLSDRMQSFAQSGTVAADELAHQTLPKLDATMTDLQNTAHALEGLSRSLQRNPQQLLFGPTKHRPGPGEPGFKGSSGGG
ncbi:MAG TPA: MlaD family protein [Gammaproteobacteria bacterium]|nr:MlaD family protein [Gammaproteobacteria bacterium]